MRSKLYILTILIISSGFAQVLRPYTQNPFYWQYKGEPVLLLGASNNDNLFQSSDFEDQLYRLKAAGGNFIRCTMSSRDRGDVQPHKKIGADTYDLNELDESHRNRFERLISLASNLNIFVQIEVWDRFDYTRSGWKKSSFNPGNTDSYNYDQTGLDRDYADQPYLDKQPFFHSIKGMPRYKPNLEKVLESGARQ